MWVRANGFGMMVFADFAFWLFGFGISNLEACTYDFGFGNLDLGDVSSTWSAQDLFWSWDLNFYSLGFGNWMCKLGFGNLDLIFCSRDVGC